MLRAWRAWGRWRRRRPFWGGLLIALAGAEILVSERAPIRVIVRLPALGLAGYLLPIVMVVCGLLLWFNPQQRLFYSIVAVLLSLGTWVTSNLGGFVIGLVLGVIGASMAFGWTPRAPEDPPAAGWPTPGTIESP